MPASLSDLDPDLLRQALQSQEQHIHAMGQELDRLKGDILRREERSNTLHKQLAVSRLELLQELAERDKRLATVRAQLDSVLASTSWRAMAAVRRIFRRYPRAARLARRLIKVAWLAVTLQLPARIRQYAVAAKARRLAPE